MKLARVTDRERFYRLQPSELPMLLLVLGSFPRLHQPRPLSKTGEGVALEEGQRLLDEAMSQRRSAMRQELEAWMKAPDRFLQGNGRWEWRIENDRLEWLLQIFNDIRVGSWVELGSPEALELAHENPAEESVRPLALMDLAGMFQMALLGEEASS